MNAETSSLITVSALSVKVGPVWGRRLAVRGLDLTLEPRVHAFLGPNGAGKTTLLRALATAIPKAAGTVSYFGREISRPQQLRELRRQIGYLPQTFSGYRNFTVRELVEYFAWLKEVPQSRRPSQVSGAIELVDLADRQNSRLGSLSGGMLRRVGIAQAIVNNPALLILDEPTAGLDPHQTSQFLHLIHTLGESTTILMSTHAVDELHHDECIRILRGGYKLFEGNLAQLEQIGKSAPHPNPNMSAAQAAYASILSSEDIR